MVYAPLGFFQLYQAWRKDVTGIVPSPLAFFWVEHLAEIFLTQYGLAPENLTTLAHLSVSSAMSLPKSAGEPGKTVPPSSAKRAFSFASARPALISLFSLSMISAGVFLGAPTP